MYYADGSFREGALVIGLEKTTGTVLVQQVGSRPTPATRTVTANALTVPGSCRPSEATGSPRRQQAVSLTSEQSTNVVDENQQFGGGPHHTS